MTYVKNERAVEQCLQKANCKAKETLQVIFRDFQVKKNLNDEWKRGVGNK